MRLRHIPGAEKQIEESTFVIQEPEQKKGCWAEVFGNENPIHIEVGMGKGKFLMELAQQNPDINYVGIEMYSSVLLKAIQKRETLELTNICFMCVDARKLADIFKKGEVAKIYLNFSDPWPKDRHAKRRLTSKEYWARYNQILCPEGRVIFKTDNRPLFDFSLEQLQEAGWHADYVSYHLHENGPAADNIMTEYEQKFYALGNPICKFRAHR